MNAWPPGTSQVERGRSVKGCRRVRVRGWYSRRALLGSLRLRARLADRDTHSLVPLHADLDLVGAEGSALEALATDGVEEGQAAQAQQTTADRGRSVTPLQARVDEPHAVLSEAGLDGD